METAPTIVFVLILAVMVSIPGWLAFGFARRGKNEKAVVVFLSSILMPLAVWWLAGTIINLMWDTGRYVGATYNPGLGPLADALYGWFPSVATIAAFAVLCVHWARQSQALSNSPTRVPSAAAAPTTAPAPDPPKPNEDTVREQLLMLERLHRDGVITGEELAAKRAQVLDRL